jgi:hypothetical protein
MIPLQFPKYTISLYDFITPFLGIYPGILFASAVAVLFECLLGKKLKNVNAAGITALFLLFLLTYKNRSSPLFIFRLMDFGGYRWITDSINESVIPIIGRPVATTGMLVPQGMFTQNNGVTELVFHGIANNAGYLLDKIALLIFCILLTFVSVTVLENKEKGINLFKPKYSPKKEELKSPSYSNLFWNELKIMFRDQTKGWWTLIITLWVISAFMPLNFAQNYIWIALLAVSASIFSQMGSREHEDGMMDFFITINHFPSKIILYSYAAGILYYLFLTAPILVRNIALGNAYSALCYIAFGTAIPAAACFLGDSLKSRRPFETIYLSFCFLLINIPDFLFIKPFPILMLLGAILLLFVTVLKRNGLLTGQRQQA